MCVYKSSGVSVALPCRLTVSVAYTKETRACHARARAREGCMPSPPPFALRFRWSHSFSPLRVVGSVLRAFCACTIRQSFGFGFMTGLPKACTSAQAGGRKSLPVRQARRPVRQVPCAAMCGHAGMPHCPSGRQVDRLRFLCAPGRPTPCCHSAVRQRGRHSTPCRVSAALPPRPAVAVVRTEGTRPPGPVPVPLTWCRSHASVSLVAADCPPPAVRAFWAAAIR